MDKATIRSALSRARVLGIGELLWDLLPDGPRLGGAPFNAIAHLRRLGVSASYLTAVGQDDFGRRAREEVERLGVDGTLIQTSDAPTGVTRVRIDARGLPEYEIASPAAYERFEPLSADAIASLRDTDALVFGTLAQRFQGVFRTTVAVARAAPDALRVYDVNLRTGCWTPSLVNELLGLATVAKMNAAERDVLAMELALPMGSTETFARRLADQFGLRGVCVTMGAEGAGLVLDGEYRDARSVPVQVVDTIGAGDAFAAGLVAGIIARWSVHDVLELSTRLAGVVASRPGAIPPWGLSEIGLAPG